MIGKRCLVVGGNGFIGKYLLQGLVGSGYDVTSLGRAAPEEYSKIHSVNYVSGSYATKELLDELFSQHDSVVHLAYATQPNTSFDSPFLDLSENVSSTIQLFELAAKHSVRVLFVSSGGTVYGEAQSVPISEEHPTRPISPYGVTKLTLEKYAFLYAITKGLDVVCVRPANPYGQGQRPFCGQGFISTAMATAMQGKPVTIYGKQGTVRDYIYIEDLAEGMVVVLEHGKENEVYNIGSSVGRSNLDVVQAISPLLNDAGIDVRIDYEPSRPFDVKRNVLDCNKLHQIGWKPVIDFDVGLRRMFAWLRKQSL